MTYNLLDGGHAPFHLGDDFYDTTEAGVCDRGDSCQMAAHLNAIYSFAEPADQRTISTDAHAPLLIRKELARVERRRRPA